MINNYPAPWLLRGLLALVLTALLPLASQAQVATYSFTQSNRSYQAVNVDSSLGDQNTDDTNFDRIQLGFTFRYNNNLYTTASISNNGFLVLGSTNGWSYLAAASGGGTGSGIIMQATAPTGADNVVAGFVSDLQAQAGWNLGIKRSGVAGSRRFTVQWTNVKRYGVRGDGDNINFQITLIEGSNAVEIAYGDVVYGGSGIATAIQVGLRGLNGANTETNSRSGTNLTATTRASNASDQVTEPASTPTTGTIFTYTPIPPSPNDLGLVAIIAPRPDQTTCFLSAQEPVRVIVRNYGTAAQTSAPISYTLNNGTPVTATFNFNPSPLQPNATDTLTFTGAQGASMTAAGTYTFSARVTLAGELPANRVNDEVTNYTIILTGPINPPSTAFGTLAELTNASTGKWNEATGNPPVTGDGAWNTAFPFASESYAVTFPQQQSINPDIKSWLLSPAYNVGSQTFLIFKAAATAGAFGSAPGAVMGDDTVKVMVSTNCGTTWTVARKFSQVDIASGRLNNTMQEFRVPVNTYGPTLRVAFFADNRNTPAADTIYRFHLDDVQFVDVVNNDLGVTSILSPVSGAPGCVLSAAEQVRVVIKNYGLLAQDTANVRFRVNGGAEKKQRFTLRRRLQPGDQDTVTFTNSNTVDLSTAGNYNFVVYTATLGETSLTRLNDTLKPAAVTISTPFALPTTVVTTFGVANTNSWRRGQGLVQPTGTTSGWGASFAFNNPPTNNVAIGLTFNTFATTPQREWLYSPSYQVTPSTYLVFKAAVVSGVDISAAPNGMEDDTVSIRVSADCGATWRTIARFTNAQIQSGVLDNTLREFTYAVSTTNSRLSVAFFGNNNASVAQAEYRFIIDDIILRDVPANDVGVVSILSPVNSRIGCPPGNVRASIVVRNYGSAAQSNIPVTYMVNGGSPVTETFIFNPPLAPGLADTVSFGLANAINLSTAGAYRIQVRTVLNGDGAALNDTGRTTVTYSAPYVLPTAGYPQNFDSSSTPTGNIPIGWNRSGVSVQDWRKFNGRGMVLPGGGLSAALASRYSRTNARASVTTPRVQLPSGTPNLSFTAVYRVVETGRGTGTILGANDTIRMDVTNDCGQTYANMLLGTGSGYTASGAYRRLVYDLSAFAGQSVIFRFYGTARRTDADGCIFDVDDVFIGSYVQTAVKSNTASLTAAYPNPTRDRLTLERGADKGLAMVVLMDNLGRKVQTLTTSTKLTELDMSSLPTGFYTLAIRESDGSSARLKVVKE